MRPWGPATWHALRRFAAERPAWPLVAAHRAVWFVCRRLFGPRFFSLGHQRFRYLVHPFILDNERAVEIPIALDAAHKARRPGRRLEIGHVLGAYASLGQIVVDKYEAAEGVLNVDILDFQPTEGFDLILAISTFEHVGRDEEPREDEKALRAIEHCLGLLRPGGRFVATLPVGYNPAIDRWLAAEADAALGGQIRFLERHGRFNRWRECDRKTALGHSFGRPFPNGNALVVMDFCRPGPSD